MSHVICAVFDSEAQAERAVADGRVVHPIDASYQRGHWRDEDVQLAGSRATSGAVLMGAAVAAVGALVAWLFIWPAAGVPLQAWAMAPMILAGALFGVVAGGVGGAGEAKPRLQALADEVGARGRVVVTCEVDGLVAAEDVKAALERGGGMRVCTA